MMIDATTPAQSSTQTLSPSDRTPSGPKPPSASAIVDTVHISATAQALQESQETPTQTAQEAQHGDRQAQRLLAREAANRTA